MAAKVLLTYDERMLRHDTGAMHPERPDRLRAVVDRLQGEPIEGVEWAKPRAISREALERAHDPAYLDMLMAHRGRHHMFDADTPVSPATIDAAELSASAVIDAVDATLDGRASAAAALCRPPGHHAERDRAMGFCYFSNAAIGALHAVEARGLERVLIVDWDVHHGNGTQHILEDRPEVLFISLHEWPHYPGTGWVEERGVGPGEGNTVNIPLPSGCGDAEYLAAFDEIVVPIASDYRPQLVLVSAGFDAHDHDPMASMRVTTEGFAAMCARAREIAERSAGGRVVLILEGGYDLRALAEGMRMCIEDLAGIRPHAGFEAGEPSEAGRAAIDLALAAQHRQASDTEGRTS